MVQLLPLHSIPLVKEGTNLGELLSAALLSMRMSLIADDVIVVAQKIVSKAEGRLARLDDVIPSQRARDLALQADKDPRLTELIVRESREVLRIRPGLIVVEDRRGFVCANAGIDRSNIEQEGEGETVALLPVDPDESARRIRDEIAGITGVEMGVIINDSHGRAWREGTVGVAIGVAGIHPLSDRRGDEDLSGYVLQHTVIGIADEMAAAASLLMGPAAEGVPAVLIRGLHVAKGNGFARDVQRPRELDLFR